MWTQVFIGTALFCVACLTPAQRLPSSLVKLPPASCLKVDETSPAAVLGKQVLLATSNEWTTYVRFVSSSHQLRFALHVPAGAQAHVSAYAKFDDSQADFTAVCEDVKASTVPQSFLATAPLGSASLLWRMEIRVRDPSSRPEPVRFELRPLALGEDAATWSPGWAHAIGYVCSDISPEDNRHIQPSHAFGTRVKLNVDLGAIAGDESGRERATVNSAILKAAEVWVNACLGCRPNHLAVLHIGDQTYVRQGLMKWLDQKPVRPWTDAQLAEVLEPLHELSTEPGDDRGAKRMTSYVHLSEESRSGICGLPITPGATMAEQVKSAICPGPRLSSRFVANMRVRFRDGMTACGDSANIIACRADTELTEYNTRDYAFASDGSGMSIGKGAVEIDLLHALVHEMGHWIGLGHIDSGHSVMAASMERSRCIDQATVAELVKNGSTRRSEAPYPAAFTLRDAAHH